MTKWSRVYANGNKNLNLEGYASDKGYIALKYINRGKKYADTMAAVYSVVINGAEVHFDKLKDAKAALEGGETE